MYKKKEVREEIVRVEDQKYVFHGTEEFKTEGNLDRSLNTQEVK